MRRGYIPGVSVALVRVTLPTLLLLPQPPPSPPWSAATSSSEIKKHEHEKMNAKNLETQLLPSHDKDLPSRLRPSQSCRAFSTTSCTPVNSHAYRNCKITGCSRKFPTQKALVDHRRSVHQTEANFQYNGMRK
jgi:hypothetical protein